MPVSGNKTLGVYIHWPFCASKCPYCDFNSHVSEGVDHARWAKALESELNLAAMETPEHTVTSIFFGGGTPSLMDPQTTGSLIASVKKRWKSVPNMEVTLEANPSTAEAGRFRAFRDAGINRLSIGVQSLRDDYLKFLGRGHSAKEAINAIELAKNLFARLSFDLIYGLPGQTAPDWHQELAQAINLAGSHLSLYQLSIEPGTAFGRDGVEATDELTGVELYEITHERLAIAGLLAYEISNHARPTCECRHNLDIWQGGDYVGIGPGAHGRITGRNRTEAHYRIHDPNRWLQRVEEKGHGTGKRQSLPRRMRAEEIIMAGLRLCEGVNFERFQVATGKDPEDFISASGLRQMIDGRFIEADDVGIRATPQGRLCLNEVLRQLLAA